MLLAMLPLHHEQAKHHHQDTPDDLYVGAGHPQRTVVPLSARLPGSARKLQPSTAAQQQALVSPQVQEQAGAGMDQPAPHRIVASNIVPALNLGAPGADGGAYADQAVHTSRPAGGFHQTTQQQQQQQQHRSPQTSRAAYAGGSGAAAAAADAVRSTPSSVETGPITPAQVLQRYYEYLTAFEQSEVLQYKQVRACFA
jgi:hypothetical protein